MKRRIHSRGHDPLSLIAFLLVFLLGLGSEARATAADPAIDLAPPLVPEWIAPADLDPSSHGQAVFEAKTAQVEARLLVSSGPMPRVGVLFDLAPGWHFYWRNPGESGIATKLHLEGEGFVFGDTDWPAPLVFEEADGLFTTYGYEGQVLLSARVLARGEAREIRARPEILVCKNECIPASFDLRAEVEASISGSSQQSIDQRFAAAERRFPIAQRDLDLRLEASWRGPRPGIDEEAALILDFAPCADPGRDCPIELSQTQAVPFIPLEDLAFEFADIRVSSSQDSPRHWRFEMDATRIENGEDRIRGLVPVRDRDGRVRHIRIDAPISGGESNAAALAGGPRSEDSGNALQPTSAAANEAPGAARWLQVLLLALIGGLILNGMPCVLPVLAIKVVAIADLAEKDAREVRLQGLAYTAGVLGSMMLLGALVLSLRMAGHSVGWGFQFQEPLFVAGISAVLVTFALNLFGVFEIDFGQGRLAAVGQDGSATRRSLFEGLLAVVLATPCTAPFLGTAVGFAFAAPGIGILAIFLAIGLGLALPFLIVSFVPTFARFIPRSGPWMLKLRTGLGFCLLATVVWLLWIVGQSGGTEAVIGMVSMLLLLSFLLWGFGQAQPLASAWRARASALLIAGIAIAGFNLIGFEATHSTGPDRVEDSTGLTAWAAYSESAVANALAAGRPAFVVFTADWCITCKVNEKRVIERPATIEALQGSDVALFKADWTRRDEGIRQKLAEFGRAGVPLYLVYSPEKPNQPEVLSELLGAHEIQAALVRIGAGKQATPRG